jgi:hypothetical protein
MSLTDSPEALTEPRLGWSESVWFTDVDDTLIDTAGTSYTASDGIHQVFEQSVGAEKAAQV